MIASLPVVESFHSIQGEGAHAGRSAFFIRLAKCEVGCSWCDTKHSWDADSFPEIPVQQLAKATNDAARKGAEFVVITGGEPLHHNLDPLCDSLKVIKAMNGDQAIPIHLETSGVNHISGAPDWITLSPKRHAPPRKELLGRCKELKVIIHEIADLHFAEAMAQAAKDEQKNKLLDLKSSSIVLAEPLLFLQPGWESKNGQRLAIKHVLEHPQWRLSLQIHKLMGVQ